MSKNEAYERSYVALHEAGHVVMAVLLGVEFDSVSVDPEGRFGLSEFIPHGDDFRPDIEVDDETRLTLENDIMVSWAGALAVDLAGLEVEGHQSDLDSMTNRALYVAGSSDEASAYLEWLRIRARNALDSVRGRRGIEAVAGALMESDKLDYEQVRTLIRDALTTP